jgi:endonuclease/exonuclease/phosphatase (EEP) superfamily protein YafD
VRRAAWAPAVLLALWAVCRLLGLERGYPLVPLMAFTPLAGGIGVVATALLSITRRWGPAALAAAATIALACVVLPRVFPHGAAGRAQPLRIMSANVALDGVDASTVVLLVRRYRPDVLSLQELTPHLAAELERTGLRDLLPHAVVNARTGPRGTGLYSHLPLRRAAEPAGTTFAMAAAIVRTPGGSVEAVTVSPPAPDRPSRIGGWRRDLRALPHGDAPRILAGDFNATLDHHELRRILSTGYRDAAATAGAGLRSTWPQGRRITPGVAIDHVLVPEAWGVRDFKVLPLPGSDHRAVMAEVVPQEP